MRGFGDRSQRPGAPGTQIADADAALYLAIQGSLVVNPNPNNPPTGKLGSVAMVSTWSPSGTPTISFAAYDSGDKYPFADFGEFSQHGYASTPGTAGVQGTPGLIEADVCGSVGSAQPRMPQAWHTAGRFWASPARAYLAEVLGFTTDCSPP